MRKIYKIVGSMLVIGVLIAGIGSGVAFAEYSAFEYGGETVLEGSERFTKTLKYKVSVNGDTSKETEESEEITEVSSEETEREAETSNTEKVREYKQDKDFGYRTGSFLHGGRRSFRAKGYGLLRNFIFIG